MARPKKVVVNSVVETKTLEVSRETSPKRTRLDAKEEAKRIRAERPNYSGLEQRLAFNGENPGWKYRWVVEENVQRRLAQGYRFVLNEEVQLSESMRYGNHDLGGKVGKHSGTDQFGNPIMQWLMEIPKEIAEELDFEFGIKQAQARESSIRNGNIGSPGKQAYVPKDVPITMEIKSNL